MTEKRIVLIAHGAPPAILGCQEANEGLPDPVITTFDGTIFSLLRVTPRALIYRELTALPAGRFNDFHPEQR